MNASFKSTEDKEGLQKWILVAIVIIAAFAFLAYLGVTSSHLPRPSDGQTTNVHSP